MNHEQLILTLDTLETEQSVKKDGLLSESLKMVIGLSALYVVFFLLTENNIAALICCSFAIICFAILSLSTNKVIPFHLVKKLYPASVHFLIIGLILVTGGTDSAFIIWYGAVLCVAFFYGSLKRGKLWLILGAINVALVGLLEYYHIVSIPDLGNDQYKELTSYYSSFLFILYIGRNFYMYEKWHIQSLGESKNLTDEIVAQNEELKQYQEEIQTQNESLEKTQSILYSSLKYGRKIQSTLLDYSKLVKSSFDDAFIIERPRDIVSGDFYWCKETPTHLYLAVADCTGHGIPSAFLTLVGAANLHQATLIQKENDPSKVLEKLDQLILKDLNQGRNEGMDIGLLILDKKHNVGVYSGANTPLYIVRADELEEIKGSRNPIGDTRQNKKVFETTNIKLQKGDQVYITTDGFQDQFGGENDRKYLRKNLKNLLFNSKDLSMSEQCKLFEEEFDKWKGSNKQTDDILMVGFKY
ncbi:PP2C family protein-serine/threonine phosphatase [Sediminitomix flava]|uniref:Serine phosphatase RsbU (Regulator of sigma subunit) n=1 Tax=Sediminitomix flava TaxID=379075 RepID=A0A315ZCX1_SEDFL|nr:SpoIIE family protein phosphatase [Sediminitomix flava]PWJ42678.1 serine phosphatase RsbU (regulator of sigma subunit) [Sediminitomix flava]